MLSEQVQGNEIVLFFKRLLSQFNLQFCDIKGCNVLQRLMIKSLYTYNYRLLKDIVMCLFHYFGVRATSCTCICDA